MPTIVIATTSGTNDPAFGSSSATIATEAAAPSGARRVARRPKRSALDPSGPGTN